MASRQPRSYDHVTVSWGFTHQPAPDSAKCPGKALWKPSGRPSPAHQVILPGKLSSQAPLPPLICQVCGEVFGLLDVEEFYLPGFVDFFPPGTLFFYIEPFLIFSQANYHVNDTESFRGDDVDPGASRMTPFQPPPQESPSLFDGWRLGARCPGAKIISPWNGKPQERP